MRRRHGLRVPLVKTGSYTASGGAKELLTGVSRRRQAGAAWTLRRWHGGDANTCQGTAMHCHVVTVHHPCLKRSKLTEAATRTLGHWSTFLSLVIAWTSTTNSIHHPLWNWAESLTIATFIYCMPAPLARLPLRRDCCQINRKLSAACKYSWAPRAFVCLQHSTARNERMITARPTMPVQST